MRLKFLITLALAVAASGCASTPAGPAATIRFAEPAAPGGLPGSFREVDGKTVPGAPEVLTVTPGNHRIGYACPNTILMDGPLETTGEFEAGATYLLRCDRSGGASFERQ
jgi:hypothetical protein